MMTPHNVASYPLDVWPISPSLLGFIDRDQQEVDVKPRVFVASSSENLSWAKLFQRELAESADVTLWSQGVFRPMDYPLESLMRKLDDADFGLFICVPEDSVQKRNVKGSAVRDNVLVELGLYLGRLGRHRSFIAIPENAPQNFLPTDFLGLNPVKFQAAHPPRQDGVGAACGHIVEQMSLVGLKTVERQLISLKTLEQLAVCFSELKTLLDNEQFLHLTVDERLNTAVGRAHGHAQSVVQHAWPDQDVVLSLKLPITVKDQKGKEEKKLKCYYLNDRMPPRRLAMSPPLPEPGVIPLIGSVAGAAFLKKAPIFVPAMSNPDKELKLSPKLLDAIRGKVGSVVACPVRLQSEVVGVVKLDAEREGFFYDGDVMINAVLRAVVSCFEMAMKIATVGAAGLGSSLAQNDSKKKRTGKGKTARQHAPRR